MQIGVPRETAEGERRVALVPEVIKKLTGSGLEVVVERGAGEGAMIPDAQFEEAGATLGDATAVWGADVVAKVAPPSAEEVVRLRSDGVLIGFLAPLTNAEGVRALAASGATAFALEAVPRISRAQSMDALSSQSNVAGYRAALIGAQEMGRFYPMLMTAAGTIRPATVLVLGAGVAGLQAIATARRLGAVVQGFDVRAVVKEQVESLGATFLEFDLGGDLEGEGGYAKELTPEQQARQQELMAEAIGKCDVVITTALVPGRRAPILVTEDAVKRMKPGSVIVDLAGEAGGNCELTEPGETVIRHDVKIVAPLNVPSTMAEHSSQLYARNIEALLGLMVADGELKLDFDDEVIAGACVTRGGEIVHEGAAKAAGAATA
jgi:NAD(P) transhydrogenase subunit alpha